MTANTRGISKFVELMLTCENRAEAEKIVDCLLEKQLIACAKFVNVDSRYRWQSKIVQDQEVLLLMESIDANFAEIEKSVRKLHSYDTFVLKSLPIEQISKQAAEWLEKELHE